MKDTAHENILKNGEIATMTTEVIKEKGYTEYHGDMAGNCPKCGNNELDYTGNEIDGEEVVFYFTCPKCGGAGSETYYMEFQDINIIIDD